MQILNRSFQGQLGTVCRVSMTHEWRILLTPTLPQINQASKQGSNQPTKTKNFIGCIETLGGPLIKGSETFVSSFLSVDLESRVWWHGPAFPEEGRG